MVNPDLTPSGPTSNMQPARPETPRGSTPAVKPHTRSAPKSRGIPLDEARLRPHLRQVQPPAFKPGEIETAEPQTALGALTKTIVPSPGELRGIPVIGHGGAIPGTDPAKHDYDRSQTA